MNNFLDKNIKIVSRSVGFEYTTTAPSGWETVETIIKYLSGNGPHPDNPNSGLLDDEDRILFIFPSGNEYRTESGYSVTWPGSLGDLSNIICVGQTTFSESKIIVDGGSDAIQNPSGSVKMECMAPSVGVIGCTSNVGNGTGTADGSSKSTAIVAGALALAMEKYNVNAENIESFIRKTNLAYSGEFYSLNKPAPECFNESSYEIDYTTLKKYYGYGLLNIKGILNLTDSDSDGMTDLDELVIYDGDNFQYRLNPWNPDTDNDFMLDGWEYKYYRPFGNASTYFDPLTYANGTGIYENFGDSDNDLLLNMHESQHFANPFMTDTDSDNLQDNVEVYGYFIGFPGSFPNPSFYFWVSEDGKVKSDPTKPDSDADGLTDIEELTGTRITVFATCSDGSPVTYINHLVRTCPTHSDTDLDGLSDADELSGVTVWTYANNSICSEINVQLNPLNPDLDDDCLLDGMEVNGFLNPSNIEETFYADPRLGDTDQDGVCDGNETYYSLDPLDFDRDDDLISDGNELNGYHGYVTDPAKSDTDSDGINDNVEIFGIYLPSSDNANGTGYIFTDPTDSDDDNDSILDGEELILGSDGYLTDPTDQDTDSDGLDDDDEINIHSTNPSENDTDNDGLIDSDELWIYLTDPTTDDSDNDGLEDYDELFTYFIDPLDNDTDNDNLLDGYEVLTLGTDPDDNDSDNDTILDGEEVILGSDGFITDPLDADTDNDGLDDADEINTYGTDPTDSDSDNDGWSDGFEVNTSGTEPTEEDTDDDGIDDKDEFDYWKSRGKTNATAYAYCDDDDVDNDGLDDGFEIDLGVDPLDNDCDNDGLLDGLEVNNYQTDPEDSDTDGDSYDDLYEIINGYDPLDPDDYPGSGGWGWG
ncbi:MAG: S8 family serine peptidase [Candidatus Heimdallarchaeota archaeon]